MDGRRTGGSTGKTWSCIGIGGGLLSNYVIPGDTLTEIADAIRAKRDIVTEITPEDMALQVSLIDGGGGGGLRTVNGEIELALPTNYFTIEDNLGTAHKMIVWSPAGTCTVDAANRCVGGIAVAASAMQSIITANVSSYNTATPSITGDFLNAEGASDRFQVFCLLSGANTATAFGNQQMQGVQSASQVLFTENTSKWWSYYIVPKGKYKYTVIAFD